MPTPPSELRDEAIELYLDGLTILEVINHLGVSERRVRGWIREAGIARPRGTRSRATREAAELRRGEASEEAIAYKGGWVRDGLVWRPAQTDAA